MTCFNSKLKPFSVWVIVSYRWKVPYIIQSTIRKTRSEAIKAIMDNSGGMTWKKMYRMNMRAVKLEAGASP